MTLNCSSPLLAVLAEALPLALYLGCDENGDGKQPEPEYNYFPLEVGNYWVYSNVNDSTMIDTMKVIAKHEINEQVYYEIENIMIEDSWVACFENHFLRYDNDTLYIWSPVYEKESVIVPFINPEYSIRTGIMRNEYWIFCERFLSITVCPEDSLYIKYITKEISFNRQGDSGVLSIVALFSRKVGPAAIRFLGLALPRIIDELYILSSARINNKVTNYNIEPLSKEGE